MRILHEVDPQASMSRQARRLHRRRYISPGPNTCWHVDGYDKLKPYGASNSRMRGWLLKQNFVAK